MVFKQDIGIPVDIDPAPFWDSIFLYIFESKYRKKIIFNGSSKVYKYHGVSRFIDDLCTINDGNEFLTLFKNIYPKELELKIEHEGNLTSVLDIDIKIEDSVSVLGKRDTSPLYSPNGPLVKQYTIYNYL